MSTPSHAVSLAGPGDPELEHLAVLAQSAAGSADAALAIAGDIAGSAPLPGKGSTARLWNILATIAAADLTVARVVEPHLDASAILAQAGAPLKQGVWGVFAAEAPGLTLTATQSNGGAWMLNGTKPWCSLADKLDHAVITAHVEGGIARRAFAVALGRPGIVRADTESTWVSRGLSDVESTPLSLSDAVATPVGGNNWYLMRDGFAWGGIGVAACWFGGAVGVARRLRQAARDREPDQLALTHLGQADVALHQTRSVLAAAAKAVDDGSASGSAGALLAARSRAVAFRCVETVLDAAAHGLGPGPLAFDEDHARRVADLHMYIRQHHAGRDEAALGRRILDGQDTAW